MNAKIAKLEEQFVVDSVKNQDFKKSDLFKGYSIFVNGYTNPSSDELKRIMMIHGGTFHTYRRSHTTFTIATNLPDTKIRQLTSEKIIRPEWVVDCLKANKIVDYAPYLLYTNEKDSQPSLQKFLQKKPGGVEDECGSLSAVQDCLELLNEKLNSKEPRPSTSTPIVGSKVRTLSIRSMSPTDLFVEDEELINELETYPPKPQESNQESNGPLKPQNLDKPIESKQENDSIALESKVEEEKGRQVVAKNATDPHFLTEFFNNSRLHHIATLGAGFKQYVNDLRENHRGGGFPKRQNLAGLNKVEVQGSLETTIMHIDMDCFFVSVGLRNRPYLRGLPVAVTHSKGSEGGKAMPRPGANRQLEAELYRKRLEYKFEKEEDHDSNLQKVEKKIDALESASSLSEIASCSYEARKFGIHNGMFVGSALKLCPQLKTIPYDFEEYKKVAYTLYDTIAQYTLDIEAVSCDEMYVDMTELLVATKVEVMELVRFIRDEIKSKTGCPCSAGIGKNKLQARLATKEAKPDGQHLLINVTEYIKSVPITELPGVGYSTSFKLEKLGFKTCEELQRLSISSLQQDFGKKTGETLYHFCRGIDTRSLNFENVRKSISVDVNYGIRFTENTEVEFFLKQVCEELHKRMADIRQKGKCITLKVLIRSADAPVETAKYLGTGMCDAINKSFSLAFATNDVVLITNTVINLMRSMKLPPHELRGIGVQISKLTSIGGRELETNTLKDMFKKVEAKNKAMQKVLEAPSTSDNCVNGLQAKPEKNITPSKHLTPSKVSTPSKIGTPSKFGTPSKSGTPSKRSSFSKISRRGRPQKSAVTNVSRTITSMFNRVQSFDDSNPGTSRQQTNNLEELDPEVLASLPADIREEVLREHRLLQKQQEIKLKETKALEAQNLKRPPKITNPKPGTSKAAETHSTEDMITVDEKFLEALPAELRQEVEQQIKLQNNKIKIQTADATELNTNGTEKPQKKCEPVKPDNIFLETDFKSALNNWIDAFKEPSEEDVDLLASQAAQMVQLRELPTLHLGLRFLHR